MREKEIVTRIEEIINISNQSKLNPPVELILTKDNNYILKELYDEYVNLLYEKEECKKYNEEQQRKYEQLMYVKDKMDYMKEKAKKSKNKISLLEDDIEEYLECKKIHDELFNELKPVLDQFENKQEEKKDKKEEFKQEKNETIENRQDKIKDDNIEEIIENTIQMQKINIDKIDVDELNEQKPLINSDKLLKDLADIDKLLGIVGMDEEKKDEIKIGDTLIAIEDVYSYNSKKIKAKKDNKYKVISFVSLNKDNKVINSSNLSDQTLEKFNSENKGHTNLFVISSIDKDNKKIAGSFDDITKFKKEITL